MHIYIHTHVYSFILFSHYIFLFIFLYKEHLASFLFFVGLSILIRFCKCVVFKHQMWKLESGRTLLWIFTDTHSSNEHQF